MLGIVWFCIPSSPCLQLPVIHVVGNLLWSHNVFMHQNLPYLKKVVERKQLQHPAESIKLYLSDRGPNLPRSAE